MPVWMCYRRLAVLVYSRVFECIERQSCEWRNVSELELCVRIFFRMYSYWRERERNEQRIEYNLSMYYFNGWSTCHAWCLPDCALIVHIFRDCLNCVRVCVWKRSMCDVYLENMPCGCCVFNCWYHFFQVIVYVITWWEFQKYKYCGENIYFPRYFFLICGIFNGIHWNTWCRMVETSCICYRSAWKFTIGNNS